jgi:DNA polymerase-3 subunit delta'
VNGLRPLPWQMPQWQVIASALVQRRLAHALLLVGPRGIGKRHFTAVLSQALLCHRPDENQLPCGTCQSCALIRAGTHPDMFRLEKEEGSKVVKVDDLRDFNRKLFLTSQMSQGVVGIIDPVDGLNRSAANALLKSLEEPPAGVHILLVGERWLSLPATLRSRCLILRFPLPPGDSVARWLLGQPAETPELQSARARHLPDTGSRQSRLESLSALCCGREDPIILAERWQKAEENLPELMDWLHGCIADLLKLKAQLPEDQLANKHSLKSLRLMAPQLSVQALTSLSQRVLDTRRLLEGQARPQMLLENLLASWYQSAKAGANKPAPQ